ncbi:MAG: hypothetical protein ACK5WM_14115, partial [Rhodospirillales bacterium]
MLRLVNNLPLVGKLAIPGVLVVALIAALVVQSLATVSTINRTTGEAIDVDVRRLEYALIVQSAMNAAAVAEKNVILASEAGEVQAYAAAFRRSMDTAVAATDRLIALADTPERRATNTQIRTAVDG